MSFWTPHQPIVYERLIVARWRAWEVQVPLYDAPSWHIVGYLVESRQGKVSSALLSVLPNTEEVTTKTGKIYLLEGEPGVDGEASQLWSDWQRQHDVLVLREVTTDVLEGLQPGPVHLKTLP
jgi:hypothetical protein